MEFLDLLYNALSGYQIAVIVLMVFLDLGFGVAAALRLGIFDAEKLANFYKSQVLPDVIGYTVLHVAVKAAAMYPGAVDLLGQYSVLVSEGLLALALTTVVIKLGKSTFDSIKKLGWTVETT